MSRPFLLCLALVGCSPPVLEPDAVGYRTAELETSDGQAMPVSFWFPGVSPDEGEAALADYVLASSSVARMDLEVATGPWPVVLLSHGNGGGRDASAQIAERIAELGYIVAAPDHTGNTYEDGFGSIDQFIEVFLRRPDDLLRVHDHLAAEAADATSPFFERFDGTVAVAGHSTGGSTALLAAGAGVNKAPLSFACALGQITGLACEIADQTEGPLIFPELDPFPPISALFLMAPLSATLLEGSALDAVDVPTLVAVGDQDQVTPLETDARPIYDSLGPAKALAVFEGGGHYGWATLCGIDDLASLVPDAHEECTGTGWIDPDTLVAAGTGLGVAWLDRFAKQAEAAADPQEIAAGYDPVSLTLVP